MKPWRHIKLIEIDEKEADEAILKKYAYVQVDAFFKENAPFYHQFTNKIVYSLIELRHQDRSIWFLKDADKNSAKHEILLIGSRTTQPGHFPSEFRTKRSHQLLWLSDLHFGDHHAFPLKMQNNQKLLWLALEDAIKELKLNIGGVIISGDFVYKPVEKEFEMAGDFVKNLNSGLRLDNYDYIFCPGNHDFEFNDLTVEPGREIDKTLNTSTEAYSAFYEKHFYIKPHDTFACGRRFLLNNTYPIEIVALNSVGLQQTKEVFQGYGFVSDEQLKYVEEQLDWTSSPGGDLPVRILVIHHHILPVTYSEYTKYGSRYSLTLDAEKVTRWALRHGVKLILHGHMHQLYFTQLKRPIEFESSENTNLHEWPYVNICGLGSTGVERSHLGNYSSNTFGIIQFKNNKIIIEIYKIDSEVTTNDDRLVCKTEIPINNEYTR